MKAFRLVILCFVLICIFGFGLFIGTLFRKETLPPKAPQIANTATILKQIQTLSELTTVKYVLEKVVVLEDPKWYGENRVTLIAHGIVKGGIDFKSISEGDIQVSDKKISIMLPRPIITAAYLDDSKTQVLEHSTGLLRTFDKDLQQSARKQAVGAIMSAARSLGIEKEADENAKAQLGALFRQLGFSDVEFRAPK